jgi:predicted TIM-barrel fold metal-dependent hydrolase
MNRRTFLAGVAAGAAPVPAARPAGPKQIIDTHTHFYDPTRPQGVPWPGKNEPILYQPTLPARYLKVVKPFHITGTVVVEASPWLEDNQWVLDLAKDNPVIVGVVGHLNPGTPEFKDHVARFSRNPLFRGIRTGADLILKHLDRPLMIDDLNRMVDADWELDIGGDARLFPDLVRLADAVPKLRQVINHLPYDLPGEEPARGNAQAALRELASRPQVYAKVSGVLRKVGGRVPDDVNFYRPMLDELWRLFGPDRVVYGSNWPVSDLLAPYATVFKVVSEYVAAKGPDAANKYFWKNSQAAYKWVNRG